MRERQIKPTATAIQREMDKGNSVFATLENNAVSLVTSVEKNGKNTVVTTLYGSGKPVAAKVHDR